MARHLHDIMSLAIQKPVFDLGNIKQAVQDSDSTRCKTYKDLNPTLCVSPIYSAISGVGLPYQNMLELLQPECGSAHTVLRLKLEDGLDFLMKIEPVPVEQYKQRNMYY